MVLELKAPHGSDLETLRPLIPVFLSYILSFVFIGIYWNNHHHLLQAAQHVNGKVLWANLHLLFWLSLIPFVTHWMGEGHGAPWPVALYGVILLLAGVAYYLLSRALLSCQIKNSALMEAIGKDVKGQMSLLIYAVAIPSAFFDIRVSVACYVLVAVMWLVPDRRIEKALNK